MEESSTPADELGSSSSTANHPRQSTQASQSPQLRSLDSDKQVVGSEHLSDPANAPIAVQEEKQAVPSTAEPVREADKEAIGSWQSKSREESAPIPMEYHDFQRGIVNDVKGAPAAYDDLSPQTRSGSDELAPSFSAMEPDDKEQLPPRPEDRSAVGQLLSWIPSAPRLSSAQMPLLIQPVIVPQLDVPPKGESVPFARCYSDVLASHDVSMKQFIAFLDGLAVAQAPPSALQGLKMFGAGADLLPIPLFGLAGRGIQALASSGSGHSGSRARLYLERAKKEYFAPRGLRLSVVRDTDLNPRLQIPPHAQRLAPLTKATLTSSLCERRTEGLAPYVAPLRYDVPEDEQIEGVHKLARKHLQRRVKKDLKKLDGLRGDQYTEIASSSTQHQAWDQRYTAKMGELRRLQVALAQGRITGDEMAREEALDDLYQKQRDVQILTSERQTAMQTAPAHSRAVEAEMEEEKWSRRLKWIVIENLQ